MKRASSIALVLNAAGRHRKVFATCVTAIALLISSAGREASAGFLAGYWSFDNAANDLSGNGNTMTLHGGASYVANVPSQLAGSNTMSISFNGTGGQYTSTPISSVASSLYLNSVETISYWMQANSSPNAFIRTFSDLPSGGSGIEFQRDIATSGMQLRIDTTAGGNQLTGTGNAFDGSWHLVTDVINNGNITTYLDNSLVTTGTYNVGGGFATLGELDIARSVNEGGDWFNGQIANVALFNIPLTASEVRELYAGVSPAIVIPEPSALVLLGLGAVGLAAWRARRRLGHQGITNVFHQRTTIWLLVAVLLAAVAIGAGSARATTLTAQYDFEPPTPLSDGSGNGNTLTNVGSVPFSAPVSPGSPSLASHLALQSATFDLNAAQYLPVPSAVYTPNTDFSFVAFVNKDSNGLGGGFETILSTNDSRFQWISFGNNALGMGTNIGGGGQSANNAFNTNTWYMVAYTYDHVTNQVDGYIQAANTLALSSPVFSFNSNLGPSMSQFRIGADGLSGIGGSDAFSGQIDGVQFYGSVLTPVQLLTIQEAYATPEPSSCVLGGLGAGSLLLVARRRRKA